MTKISKLSKHINWIVIALYCIYIVILTWPTLARLGTYIPGQDGDSYVHLWGFEWVRDSLLQGKSPFFTKAIFYPNGVNLYTHNFAFLNIAIWLPLQALTSSSTAYTLVFLAAFVFTAFSMFWLVKSLTNNTTTAFISGLLTVGWQYALTQFDKPNFILIGFIPLAMWAIMMLIKHAGTGNRKYAVYTCLYLSAIGLVRFQLLIISIILLLPWTLYLLARSKNRLIAIKQLTISSIVAVLIIAPTIVPILWYQLTRTFPDDLWTGATSNQSVDIFAYLIPYKHHPFLGQYAKAWLTNFPSSFRTYFPGLIPLALFVIGLFSKKKMRYFWISIFLVTFILSLGDNLIIFQKMYFPLPYKWLRATNLDGFIRFPARFNIILGIPFGILGAFGLETLLNKFKGKYYLPTLLLAIFLIGFENRVPYKTRLVDVPAWYHTLAEEEGDFGIFAVPHGRFFSEIYMNYQRIHNKGIIEGHVSRTPREAYDFIESVPLLDYFKENAGHASSLLPPTDTPNLTELFQPLIEADIRYVAFHKQFMASEIIDAWRGWMPMQPLFEDDSLVIYSTDLNRHIKNEVIVNNDISLVRVVNDTQNRRSNDILQLTTHWLIDPLDNIPTDICLSLADGAPQCQSFTNASIDGEEKQIIHTTQNLFVEKFVQPQHYTIQAQLLQNDVEIGERFSLLETEIMGPARKFSTPQMDVVTDIKFGEELVLLGYDRYRVEANNVLVTLQWKTLVENARHTMYFVHVMDENDGIVSQIDTVPRNWTYPTTEWASQEIVSDKVAIDMANVPKGSYRVMVGMIDIETSERLSLNSSEVKGELFLLDTIAWDG